ELQSLHSGDDLRAAIGTPVRATQGGLVRMAKDLFYAGQAVVLDPGLGFFTIYMHLSRFKVKEGDLVAPGQVVGLSGATGRVSGPHLHWGARVQQASVSPLQVRREIQKFLHQ